MTEPHWLGLTLMLEVQARQIIEHGGAGGVRDLGRLEAALDRPRNLFAYEEPSLFRLAASYAHGIAVGHPFIDGNKRASLLACMIFLDSNHVQIQASDDALYETWMALAAGTLSEAELAAWLDAHGVTVRATA